MEIKALGQLHFKYYTERKELQRMYSKISAQKFVILWKEMCFTGYQAFRILNCGVFVPRFVFQFDDTTSYFFIM